MIWDRKAHKDQLPVRFREEVHGGTGRVEASRRMGGRSWGGGGGGGRKGRGIKWGGGGEGSSGEGGGEQRRKQSQNDKCPHELRIYITTQCSRNKAKERKKDRKKDDLQTVYF